MSGSNVPMNGQPTAAVLIACLAAALAVVVGPGCGETIDVSGMPGSDRPGFYPSGVGANGGDSGPASSEPQNAPDAMVPSGPGMVQTTAQTLSECASPIGGAGGIAGGARLGSDVSCTPTTSIQCFGDGRGVRAQITPLDCDPTLGLTGDPTTLQIRCGEALDGESGESCMGPFSCGRASTDGSCCMEVALCPTGSSLRRYNVCPSACLRPISSGVLVASCSDMEALWKVNGSRDAWLGAPCAGAFACSSSPALLTQSGGGPVQQDLHYCANGALHLAPLFLPSL